jgi:predicted nucleotidyltransferase
MMTYEPKERQILDEVVAVLHKHYGERLSRVVLYGSRARRDHREYSDFDVLVVLHEEPDQRVERPVIAELVSPICLAHEAVVICSTVSQRRFDTDETAFYLNVKEEGVAL